MIESEKSTMVSPSPSGSMTYMNEDSAPTRAVEGTVEWFIYSSNGSEESNTGINFLSKS